jgi:hypothetical protein
MVFIVDNEVSLRAPFVPQTLRIEGEIDQTVCEALPLRLIGRGFKQRRQPFDLGVHCCHLRYAGVFHIEVYCILRPARSFGELPIPTLWNNTLRRVPD